MKARQLIGNASYGPDVLKTLYEAFDEAWARLAPACGSDPQVIESTRAKLANVILAIAKGLPKPDAHELAERAVKILGQTGQV